jgi:hypothetical protein
MSEQQPADIDGPRWDDEVDDLLHRAGQDEE